MKPDFALNFTDTSISLLHRTAKGWLKVGETPFESSDLEDALEYMRKTALGLSPGGFTTKLVIPASQILYAEVDISGGDEERTRREIASALESRTPYKADEIAWDWTRGEGRTAYVAAVARETLAEAEAFALTHKFSPVAFVAIPEESEFEGEPWFGETADARNFLVDGEEVERDSAPILLIDDARAARRRAKAARQAEAEAALLAAAQHAEAVPEATDDAATDATESVPTAPVAGRDTAPPAKVQEDLFAAPDVPAAPAETPAVQPDLPPEVTSTHDERADFDRPAPFGGASPAPQREAEAVPQSAAQPGPRVAITEITPLGSVAAAAPEAPSGPAPRINLTAGVVSAPSPVAAPTPAPTAALQPVPAAVNPPVRPAAPAPIAAPSGAASDAEADEAPFAHVPENTSFPESDEAPDLPPLPHLARRMAGLGPATGQPPVSGPLARPAPPLAAPPLAAGSRATGVSAGVTSDDALDDDLPPLPSAATMAAYNRSGRAAPAVDPVARPAGAAHANVPPAPPVDVEDDEQITADQPAAAALNGRAGLAAPARAGGAAPGAAATAARGIGSLAGLITAPSIPGTRKTRALPASPSPAHPRAGADGTEAAARSLGQSPFANPKQRGKPRFLGLILTAILLLCLALVAAWSSFYLSSNRNSEEEATQVAAAGTATSADGSAEAAMDPDVSAEDEMLADGLEPEDVGAAEAAPPADTAAATPAPEAAPDTTVEGESPAAVALLDAEDEIFLSSADAPPPAFDALSLPGPDASAEAPPGVPMPPPPYGTVYRFDENGQLIPTAAGLPTPGGYMLFEGKPPRVPPARSAVAEAAAEAARAAAAPAAVAPEAVAGPATPETGAAAALPDAGNPSLAGEAVGVTTAPAVAATETVAADPAAQPNPELADRRPRARPERAGPDDDAALQPPGVESDFASLRPRARPAIVEAASAKARAYTAAASLANVPEVQLASATVPELSTEEAANPSIMTISRRPAQKPKDFSRAVEAAVAAAVRAPEPAPEPPVETASAAPAKPAPEPAPKAKGKSAAKPDEHDEIDEPEVAAGPAPKIPTKASVAKQATFSKAINLSKVNLIGVYGTPSNRYALVRLSNGKYRKVSIGDKIDGGQVKAITQNEVRYQKGGRLVALAMPKG